MNRSMGTTEEQAVKAAARINRYWAERGWDAGAYVVKDISGPRKCVPGYCVRTSLVDGVPTRKLQTEAA